MARTLSPAAQNLVALIAIAGLTLIAERAPAETQFQRPKTPTAAKTSIAIKPIAPAAKPIAPKTTTTHTTTAQGPRSTQPVATTYRNPFSADSASPPVDVTLLPGPRSRWRTAPAPLNEPAPTRSAPPIIAPAETTPQRINLAPEAPTKTATPLRVTTVETPVTTPSALAPPIPSTQTTPPGATMSVKSAILTADTSEHAEFDWNNPPALKSLPNNNVASASRANEWTVAEPSALELPDPSRFTPQPKEPVWLESTANLQRSTSRVDQTAFEEPLQSEVSRAPINAAPPNDESTESSADEEPFIISDYTDSPEGWLAEAKETLHSAQSIGDLSAAIDLCQRVVVASPTPELGASARRLAAWAHNRRGELLIDAGQPEDALQEFQDAIGIDPRNSLAIHNRAVTLAQQNDFDAALGDFNRVIELNPGLGIAYRNRGELLAAQGKMAEAVADYTRAIETMSDDAEMYNARAHALQQLGRFDQALADLDRSISLAPDVAQAYAQRGNLLADRGQYSRALEDFEKSLAINPQLAETHRALAWVKATCPDDRYRDAYQALGAAQKAVKLSAPNDHLALDVLAAAHANAGEFNKAIETQQQAINAAPPNAKKPMQARLNLYEQHRPFRSPTRP